mgnify:CR=1 FL=1
MSERTDIVAVEDVTARLSAQAARRLFAKDGGSTIDTAFRALCVAQANSEIRTLTRSAFPVGLYTDTDTLDAEVVGKGVWLVCAIASSYHLSADETSGYAANGNRARDFFRNVNRDADARPPGSSNTPAQPRAALAATTTSSGESTSPYGRAANGSDSTGY